MLRPLFFHIPTLLERATKIKGARLEIGLRKGYFVGRARQRTVSCQRTSESWLDINPSLAVVWFGGSVNRAGADKRSPVS